MNKREPGAEGPAAIPPNAKGRASISPCAEADRNERQLRRLAAFLEDAVGFQLALVTYDTPELRDRQLKRLADLFGGGAVFLTQLDLTETPQERQLLERLRRHLAGVKVPHGKRLAVMVVGLEATLDYRRLGPEAAEGLAVFQNANAQRDAFARECPVAVALWLNPTATSALATSAADLWHWRNGTFCFTVAPELRREIEHRLVEMPVAESFGLPKREKLERIASLRDLLAESAGSAGADTPRARQRRRALLNELGLAHLGMGDAQRAIPVFEEGREIAVEIGDRRGEGNALGNLGIAYVDLGQVEKAIGYYEQGLVIDREIGDRGGEGNDLGNLGIAYADLGQVEKAIGLLEQALGIGQEIKDPQIVRIFSRRLERLRGAG